LVRQLVQLEAQRIAAKRRELRRLEFIAAISSATACWPGALL